MKTKEDTGNVAIILSLKTEIFKFFEKKLRSSEGGGILKESLFTTAYIGPKMGKRFGPSNVNAITAAYFAMMTQFMGWRTEQACSTL